MNAADVTELLRDMRHQAGLTQGQLGERIGWKVNQGSVTPVGDYENGRRIPKFELIGRWAEACGFYADLVVRQCRVHDDCGETWVIELNDKATP